MFECFGTDEINYYRVFTCCQSVADGMRREWMIAWSLTEKNGRSKVPLHAHANVTQFQKSWMSHDWWNSISIRCSFLNTQWYITGWYMGFKKGQGWNYYPILIKTDPFS